MHDYTLATLFVLSLFAIRGSHKKKLKNLPVLPEAVSAVSSPKPLFTNREQGLNQSFSTCRKKGIIGGSKKFIFQRKGKN
jgi:hypothetical protein